MSGHLRGWCGALAALALLVALPAWAKGAFEEELGSNVAEIADDEVDLSMMNGDGDGEENGRGPRPYLKALKGAPPRIALISFIVRDSGNKQENSWKMYGGNYVYHTTSTRTISVDEFAIDRLANELHDIAIPALKETFATIGSQLLTPAEFLDTDAKREAYNKYEIERGTMEKFYRKMLPDDKKDFRFSGVPTGYRLLELTAILNSKLEKFDLATTGAGVGPVAKSAGYDLAKALDVDAVAFLYNIVQAQKKAIVMRGSYMYLFGPNPVPESGQSLYWHGHQYSGVALKMDDIEFIETDSDGKMVRADYAGYALVARALALRTVQQLKKNGGFPDKPLAAPAVAPAAAPSTSPGT